MSEATAQPTEITTEASGAGDLAPQPGRFSTVIEPPSGWQLINLREFWQYRELLFFLTWRDIKVRYKQTVLGAAWTLLQPLVTMTVFTFVFGHVLGIDKQIEDVPYPIFVLSGLLAWNLFSGGLSTSSSSVLQSSNVLTKIYFPRLLIPIASIGVNLVNLVISLVVLLVFMLIYIAGGEQFNTGPALLLLPLVIVGITLTTLSIGIGLSAVMVTYRDVRHIAPFIVQIMLYLTPVIYDVTIVPEGFRWLLVLNPMTGMIGAFRYCLLGRQFDPSALLVSVVITAVLFVASTLVFRRAEATFADVI